MASRHPNASQVIARVFSDTPTSFAELETRISALGADSTKLLGDAFEVFVEAYLATQPVMQADDVWLVGNIPLEVRLEMNLPNDAKGIDGVFRSRAGTLVPYQVKFRSSRPYLTYTEVSSFLGLTERARDRLLITNSNEVARDAKNRDGMRTLRGIDFDDLTPTDFEVIVAWLKQRPATQPPPTKRPHQAAALEGIHKTFETSDRAHVVMACGTGKTLVALWAAQDLKPKSVLVLLPSLTLLQQTLGEWSKHNEWGQRFSYLCVCSDPTVAQKDEADGIHLAAMDVDFRVDTDPEEVRRFIEQPNDSVKVVFSTYQSSRVVAEAMAGLGGFDVAIFDEAHKTTGPTSGLFAFCLKDENLTCRTRLFLTATPRRYDINKRDDQGDFRFVSMDDEAVYGPRDYTLTVGRAAADKIICDYRVVISVVEGREVDGFALENGITLVDGDLVGAKWVANQIAVERAIAKTGAQRAITFHSRVSSARDFSSDGSRGVGQFLDGFSVFHVNGGQSSSDRKGLIRAFRDAPKALITNARCLTEGVDVPAVDMVAFIDPRHSRVDIAQAAGRAMRRSGEAKTHGFIVIPLYLERAAGETLEEALERSDFKDVATVLNAMREQDEDLVDIIRGLKEAKGRGEVFDPSALADKVQVIGPAVELSALTASVQAEIVDWTGSTWDEWFGRLLAFMEREGHCRVPVIYKTDDGHSLGMWATTQRASQDSLPAERRRRLDEIGFVWDSYAENWEAGFAHLQAFREREGHCRPTTPYKTDDGYPLGQWASSTRRRAARLSNDQRRRLEEIGFAWSVHAEMWDEGFAHLQAFMESEGHCRVSKSYKADDGYSLRRWIKSQRDNQDTLSDDQRRRLEEIDFAGGVRAGRWEKCFAHLQAFKEREGHCRVPVIYKTDDGFSLVHWIKYQRNNQDTLSDDQRRRLDGIGFLWGAADRWEKCFAHLQALKEREGHCRVPKGYMTDDGYGLYNWVQTQRENKDHLTDDQRRRLDGVGFVWKAR